MRISLGSVALWLRTFGLRQAGISEQDCASSKLKLMVVRQVKGVKVHSLASGPFRPSKSLELDGKDPTRSLVVLRSAHGMGDDCQFLFLDDGNWLSMML
jgi:hypothetical protein